MNKGRLLAGAGAKAAARLLARRVFGLTALLALTGRPAAAPEPAGLAVRP